MITVTDTEDKIYQALKQNGEMHTKKVAETVKIAPSVASKYLGFSRKGRKNHIKGTKTVQILEGQRKRLKKSGERSMMLSKMHVAELGKVNEIENKKRRLKALMEEKAFLVRSKLNSDKPFLLASGDESWVFFDCKPVTQNPEGISLIAEIYFDMVKDYSLDAIGGIQTGAIPICTAVAQLSYLKGAPIPAFWVREKRKEHGTMNKIEGGLQPNSRVVVVDDVTTKGTSVLRAVEAVKEINCEIMEVITLVDREAGAKKIIEQLGLKYSSIFKKSDFRIEA